MMNENEFTAHVARIRARFASSLGDKIAASFEALEKMRTGSVDSIEIMIVTHRMLHEMRGIAPTLGFDATGNAAGDALAVVHEAVKAKRKPSPAEYAAFESAIVRLREAAAVDLRNISAVAVSDAP